MKNIIRYIKDIKGFWSMAAYVAVAFILLLLFTIYLAPPAAEDQLIEDLKSILLSPQDNDLMKSTAARALGKTKRYDVIEALVVAYENNPSIRPAIIHAFKDLGISGSDLMDIFNSSASTWENLLRALKKIDWRSYIVYSTIIASTIGIVIYRSSRKLSYKSIFAAQNPENKSLLRMLPSIVVIGVLIFLNWIYIVPQTIDPIVGVTRNTVIEISIESIRSAKDEKRFEDIVFLQSVIEGKENDHLRSLAAIALGEIGDLGIIESRIISSWSRNIELSNINNQELKSALIWSLGNILSDKDNREDKFNTSLLSPPEFEYYDRAIALDMDLKKGSTPYIYLQRAKAYIAQGDYQLAIADLNQVILYRPTLSEAHYYKGLAYSLSGEYQNALHDLDMALTLEPEADYYCGRGIVYYSIANEHQHITENLRKSVEDLVKCLELGGERDNAHYFLGLAYDWTFDIVNQTQF